ncbi:MAG: hypothetical protein V3S07_03350 [Micropepsaceae bacterium]
MATLRVMKSSPGRALKIVAGSTRLSQQEITKVLGFDRAPGLRIAGVRAASAGRGTHDIPQSDVPMAVPLIAD